LKGRLVRSLAERSRRIESGDQLVVGVNAFTETEPSPLGTAESILRVDPAVEAELVTDVKSWRAGRDALAVRRALDELRRVADSTENIMPATIALAHAGGTTGEWADTLREVFGEFHAPTGVAAAVGHRTAELAAVASRVQAMAGGPPKLLVAKPGLDGHSNGAEQIAVAARDAGMEVVYSGIRLTPEQIAASARDEDPDVVGLSILSGSHLALVPEVLRRLEAEGVDAPVVVGGIIPGDDEKTLRAMGVAAVYTPKDFDLGRIMDEIATIAASHRGAG
jgi:(2R)-ethylmalonyl-CoA mutase